jgi:sigma-B regulation protein RsbU (phosphoserine phosphatase)
MKFSLRSKTIILVVVIAAILGTAGILVSSHYINRLVDESYKKRADEITKTVATVLDPEQAAVLKKFLLEIYRSTENRVFSDEWGSPEFNSYVARFSGLEKTSEFQSLLTQLRKIQDVNDVDCLYLTIIDAATEGFIYLVDAAEEDPCPPGCLDPIYEDNRELLTNPERGFPAYITNTDPYGWLVTAGVPVYNDAHEVICYAMVDISMEAIRSEQRSFTTTLTAVLLGLTFIICALSILIINRFLIDPINMLSSTASHYQAGKNSTEEIDSLHIKTEDEIQSLYMSIKTMMHDINVYFDNLMSTTHELTETKIKADKMDELAHRDPLTRRLPS